MLVTRIDRRRCRSPSGRPESVSEPHSGGAASQLPDGQWVKRLAARLGLSGNRATYTFAENLTTRTVEVRTTINIKLGAVLE